jgi:hypothetical protein
MLITDCSSRATVRSLGPLLPHFSFSRSMDNSATLFTRSLARKP